MNNRVFGTTLSRLVLVLVCSSIGASAAAAEDHAPAAEENTPDPNPAADRRPLFIHSNFGPEAGQTNVGIGGRLMIVVPMVDFHAVTGLTRHLEAELHLSTLGVFNLLDIGLKARLFGNEHFSFGLRSDLTTMVAGIGIDSIGVGAFALAATPGTTISFGNRSVQVSMIMDTPYFFVGGAGGYAEGAETTHTAGDASTLGDLVLRPAVAAEFSLTDTSNFWIMAQAYVLEDAFFPFLALGTSY